jgi:hypothetical protein
MDENQNERGPSPSLRLTAALAVLLALGAAACLLQLLDSNSETSDVYEMFAWVLGGAICAVFSAACAVIVAIKRAELRLRRRGAHTQSYNRHS